MFAGRNYVDYLNSIAPSSSLSTAQSLGIEVVYSLNDAPDFLILVDYRRTDLRLVSEARKIHCKSVLVVQEPEVVLPQHSKPSILTRFDAVLRIGRPNEIPPLKWPQSWRTVCRNPDRIQSAVMINSDKWSFVPGHLYWLRAALAVQSKNLVVYGYGWERPYITRLSHRLFELLRILSTGTMPSFKGLKNSLSIPITYHGETRDKVSQMSNYAVAVVIENSREFVSEKLFDAWFAGCVPVYVGPNIENMGIPPGLVILSNPDVASVQDAIEKALSVNKNTFLDAIEEYLDTKGALEWSSGFALRSILSAAMEANDAR